MVAIAAYIAASRGSRRDVPRRLRQPVTRCSQMRQLRPAHEVCSASCRSPKIGSVHAITFLRGWNGAPRLQLRYIVPGGIASAGGASGAIDDWQPRHQLQRCLYIMATFILTHLEGPLVGSWPSVKETGNVSVRSRPTCLFDGTTLPATPDTGAKIVARSGLRRKVANQVGAMSSSRAHCNGSGCLDSFRGGIS